MVMSTLYTATGWVARFKAGLNEEHRLPVESWGPDGSAMIVDSEQGQLVPARQSRDFISLEHVGRIVDVVTAQPGWYVISEHEASTDEDERFRCGDIAAWLVLDDGSAEPLIVDEDFEALDTPIDGKIFSPIFSEDVDDEDEDDSVPD